MHDFAQPGVFDAACGAADGYHLFHIGRSQALPQDPLAYHAGCAKD